MNNEKAYMDELKKSHRKITDLKGEISEINNAIGEDDLIAE